MPKIGRHVLQEDIWCWVRCFHISLTHSVLLLCVIKHLLQYELDSTCLSCVSQYKPEDQFCLVRQLHKYFIWNGALPAGGVKVFTVLWKSPVTLLGNFPRNRTDLCSNLFSFIQGRYLVQNQWPDHKTVGCSGINLIYRRIPKYS